MSIRIKSNTEGKIDSGLEKRINRHESIIYAVILILVFMLGQLLIDSFRFSSVSYKEYSEKLKSINTNQEVNRQILEQNFENQKLIIDLQKRILNKNK